MPQRKPSLHILEEDLGRLIEQFFQDSGNDLPCSVRDLVGYIMMKGKNKQILSRSILDPNKKDKVKAERITSSASGDAQLFASILHVLRLKKKHRGITKIREGSSDWQFIKEGTSLANSFYENFKDEFKNKNAAYVEYLENFMGVIEGVFTIRRMASFNEKIVSRFEASLLIRKQPDLEEIYAMHDYYQQKVFEKTGNNFDYKNRPEQFIHFIMAHDMSIILGIKPKQFIDSQFEALDFASAIPYPQQLSNSKASERTIRWMSENNIRKNNSRSAVGKSIINKLKELGKKYENNTEQ